MMIRATLAGVAVAAALVSAAQAQQSNSDLVKRGDYLVNTIMTCGNCHSPKGPQGDIPGKEFSGGLSWDEPPFKVTAPNITQDKDTGIGAWSDADIKKALRTGVRPNGGQLAMTYATQIFPRERARAIYVCYLRLPAHAEADQQQGERSDL